MGKGNVGCRGGPRNQSRFPWSRAATSGVFAIGSTRETAAAAYGWPNTQRPTSNGVFKFALDRERLDSLKQEAKLSRVLHPDSLRRSEFARVLEWNFVNYPYFLESEFGGKNLAKWAEDQGGLNAIPIETRLQIIVEAAKAVAVAP